MSGLAFPAQPNRPTQTGRGQREPTTTIGLRNHQSELRRNAETAHKAAETRKRNAAAAAAPTPSTSVATPSRPPPSALPPRLQPSTPSSPRSPFSSTIPQQSVQSSPTGYIQLSNAPRLPPLLQRPENYQPRYPDYAASQSSSLLPSSSPPMDFRPAQLSAMLARMSPAQFNEITQRLTMPMGCDPSSSTEDPPTDDAPPYPLFFDGEGGRDDDTSSAINGANGGNDDDEGEPECPWNNLALDGEGAVDEEDPHQNARSSLEASSA
ncbi:hypothetical protein C8R44DRAFT_895022 [Mycena epipterygia]|nr:hypothetical protein C8R44DRAFT_895022 [Mycena epipterygia]